MKERLKGCTEWETFEATQEARLLPGGLGNTDDFFTEHWPGFVGMSLRLYNARTRKWSIYWASNRIDGLEPPVVGSFENGVGVFEGRQQLDGRPILVRFTWSSITDDRGALGAGVLARRGQDLGEELDHDHDPRGVGRARSGSALPPGRSAAPFSRYRIRSSRRRAVAALPRQVGEGRAAPSRLVP